MPAGLADIKDRNPLNFDREEWQQAKRAGLNPKDIKRIFQDCWAISDSTKAFAQALLSQGLILARGDRRGYVAVDYQGEVYAIAKYTGARTKVVREKLGNPETLPSVEQAKAQIADSMSDKLKRHLHQAEQDKQRHSASFEFKRKALVESQRAERNQLEQTQKERWEAEANERAKRLTNGFKGIWHRLTGKYAKAQRQNEMEALLAIQRDRKEKDELIFKHIEQRQQLSLRQRSELNRRDFEIEQLKQDIDQYRTMKPGEPSTLKEEFRKASEKPRKSPKREKGRNQDRGYEPEI